MNELADPPIWKLTYPRHNDCNNRFSIFKNTIFEKTTTDLRKWMYAIHLFLNSKKGISGLQLKREVGVTYKTAWRMPKLTKEAMGNVDYGKIFEAIVVIDKTYMGGKPRKITTNLTSEEEVLRKTQLSE